MAKEFGINFSRVDPWIDYHPIVHKMQYETQVWYEWSAPGLPCSYPTLLPLYETTSNIRLIRTHWVRSNFQRGYLTLTP